MSHRLKTIHIYLHTHGIWQSSCVRVKEQFDNERKGNPSNLVFYISC